MRHLSVNSKLFSNNRKKLCGKLSGKAIAVTNANDVLPTNADGTLPLHPNSDLFYLSGIEQEESLLVLFPDCSNPKHREILFVRQPSEHLKIWEGYKHSKEDAQKISGIQTVYWTSNFDNIFQLLAAEAKFFILMIMNTVVQRMKWKQGINGLTKKFAPISLFIKLND